LPCDFYFLFFYSSPNLSGCRLDVYHTATHDVALKMICNDFLVVKVNCWSYVFNIFQSIRILRNIKDKKIAEKKRLKVLTDDLFTVRK